MGVPRMHPVPQRGSRPAVSYRPEQWERCSPEQRHEFRAVARRQVASSMGMDDAHAGGELPRRRAATGRRNFVITQWDWAAPDSFIHDNVSTDKRNPTMYAYGNVYGADRTGGGRLWVLDPLEHTVTMHLVQPRVTRGFDRSIDYYHDRETGTWMASPHNPMLDEQGRVWMTQPVRPGSAADTPKWARQAIATETEIRRRSRSRTSSGRRAAMACSSDSSTPDRKFQQVDTVYNTHHLRSISRAALDQRAATSSRSACSTRKSSTRTIRSPPRPPRRRRGCGSTKRREKRPGSGYATAVSPVDGSVCTASVANGSENKLIKFDPATRKFTDYLLPAPGRLSHGIDFSTDGVVWFSAGSGHLGRLDPKTEKFTFWQLPGPKYPGTGAETGSTEYPYFLWVDQFNASGLGQNTVIVTGTSSDSMLIFDPKAETFSVVRMPYPMPFFTRGLDGRIDDARVGWKGRGLWASYNSYMPRFSETRMGT